MINQFAYLYGILRDFLDPIRNSFSKLEELEYLFYRYGWDVSLTEADLSEIGQRLSISGPLQQFLQEVDALEALLASDDKDFPGPDEIEPLAEAALDLFRSLTDLRLSNLSNLFAPLNEASFWSEIGQHLLDDMLEEYVRIYNPPVYLILHLFGVIRYDFVEPAGEHRRPYTRTSVDWDQLIEVIKNPLKAFKKTYHWDDPNNNFEYQRLLSALQMVLRATGLRTALTAPDQNRVTGIPADAGFRVKDDAEALLLHLLYSLSDQSLTVYELGFELLPALQGTQTEVSGLVLGPILRGGLGVEIPLTPDFNLIWQANADAGSLLSAAIFPGFVDWASGPLTSGTSLELRNKGDAPRNLLGNPQTIRVEMSAVSLRFAFTDTAEGPEIKLHLDTSKPNGDPGLKAIIPLDEADGFVQDTVNRTALEFSFDMGVIWSNQTGLSFNSGASLDIVLPLRQKIGPLTILNARIELAEGKKETSFSSLEVRLGAEIQGKFGPVFFVIDQLGFTIKAIPYSQQDLLALPPGQGPIFGNLDLDLGFSPPRRIGIKIDTGAVVGGGFLDFDLDNQRYAGILQLEFSSIKLKATGLLTTRMPDGSDGYSLLIIISAEFDPIQLGFGFTLNGVGGLAGIHRTVAVEVLRTGLKEKTLDGILFPEDPIRDATKIISDLRAVFPPAQGRHVFGPMAQIGWGTPTIITAEIGVILELPAPLRLIILGQAKCILPSEDEVLVQIHIDVLGVVEFDKGELSIDATIYDSRLLAFELSGDMALRSRWKNDPTFALAFGGLNPRFQPPPGFPILRRMQVNLGVGDNPRVDLNAYLAVTSNTVQIGAHLDLYAKAGGFSVSGGLGFDALFILSPFSFIADISGYVDVAFKGKTLTAIYMDGTLSGPRPWRAKGKVTFKILWIKYSKSFDKPFGDDTQVALPPVAPWPELQAALADPRNWSAPLPADADLIVTIRRDPDPSGAVRVHPMGFLEVRQKVLPLNHKLTQFGGGKPEAPDQFRIFRVHQNEKDLEATPVQDFFAPAQFEEMSDDDKLARKSFEKMQAGVQVASGELLAPDPVASKLKYETKIMDQDHPGVSRFGDLLDRSLALAFLSSGAAKNAPINTRGNKRFSAPGVPPAVRFAEEGFVIAGTNDLQAREEFVATGSGGVTQAQAFRMLEAHLADHPEDRDMLQVVPEYEVTA